MEEAEKEEEKEEEEEDKREVVRVAGTTAAAKKQKRISGPKGFRIAARIAIWKTRRRNDKSENENVSALWQHMFD